MATTHRGFVNTWECDENDHWNVQFYMRALQQASEILAVRAGQPNPGARTAPCRHVRYHRELRAGASLIVRSGLVTQGGFAGTVVHRLENSETGELSATAIDHPGYRITDLPHAMPDEVEPALPRGVTPGPQDPEDTVPLLARGQAIESHLSVVGDWETGVDGDLLADRILARFSDSAAHVWSHAGVTGQWLEENGLGRVAVELKLMRFAPIRAGQALIQVSWVADLQEKTLLLAHQIEDCKTRQPLAGGQVRGLLMDLADRRAVSLAQYLPRQQQAGQ